MAACRVADVRVLSLCTPAGEPLIFEITLDVAEPLAEDVLFRCVYIVDAGNPKTDIELEAVDVGNGPGLPVGLMRFNFESDPPSKQAVEEGGALDVGGIYISASYRGAEFCRVGYFVRHEYDDPMLQENPPQVVDWSRLRRVLSDPRVTRFPIAWDERQTAQSAPMSEPASGDQEMMLTESPLSRGDASGERPAQQHQHLMV